MRPDHHQPHPPEPGSGPDALERLLARQTFRTPPPEWRDDILARALAATTVEAPPTRANVPRAPADASRWSALLHWLNSGWSPIAAAWLLVLGLNLYSAQTVEPRNPSYPPLSAASLAELSADRAELLELANLAANHRAGESPARPRNPPPNAEPRPRAQRPTPSPALATLTLTHTLHPLPV